MAFDFRSFFRFAYLALFRSRGTNYRLTPHRIRQLVAFYAIYLLFEAMAWSGFLLDELLYPGYRRETITEPLFIVGNPRSGTTFLHRLLAQDEATFTTLRLWEAMLAPSVCQREILRSLAAIDRKYGGRLRRLVVSAQDRPQQGNVMHRVRLSQPEEDQVLLWHIWSTIMIWEQSAIVEGARDFVYFDALMSQSDKQRIMRYYAACIRRHLYASRLPGSPAKRYLSKSPAFAAKVGTLLSTFPDARIILLVRNPLDVIPSYISLLRYAWRFFGDPLGDGSCREFVLETVAHWYRYPMQGLEQYPDDRYTIIRYEDLVADADQTVRDTYAHFGYELGPNYAPALARAAERARNYRSPHEYSLEEAGLTREAIIARFGDVFDRFGFPTQITGE